ncbi:hypothetical protein AB0O91_09080 [Kitasatospora sp. NPDC089797]|uniref:hypothetical protein n=1 Tax=Kitasatospora sp. NPDC089797 TaxID=3155298 RepID=UPI00344A4702
MSERPVEVWRLPEEERRAGRRAVAWTVGPGGELAVLLVPEEYAAPAGSWASVRLPFDGEVLVAPGTAGERRVPLGRVPEPPDHLALLPGGRVLLAGARAEQQGGEWLPNGSGYGPDGTPGPELALGDDIRVLVTGRDGRIWMAYGDEGIYGDHPLSCSGLRAVDTRGRSVWSPDRAGLPGHPLEGLAGATEGPRAWLAWYPGSSGSYLTRVDPADGTQFTVPCPVRLPVGFAIRGREGVFLSRDGELSRQLLVGKTWKRTGRSTPDLPGEPDRERAFGRDGVLWFRRGGSWYRVSV